MGGSTPGPALSVNSSDGGKADLALIRDRKGSGWSVAIHGGRGWAAQRVSLRCFARVALIWRSRVGTQRKRDDCKAQLSQTPGLSVVGPSHVYLLAPTSWGRLCQTLRFQQ